MVFQNRQTDFIGAMLRQHPVSEPLTVFFLGVDVGSGLLSQLQFAVEHLLEELGYVDVAYVQARLEVEIEQHAVVDSFPEAALPDVRLVNRPTLILPVIDLMKMPRAEPPVKIGSRIIQVIQHFESYGFLRRALPQDTTQSVGGTDSLIPIAIVPLLIAAANSTGTVVARLVASEVNKKGYGAHIAIKAVSADISDLNASKGKNIPAITIRERWAPTWVAILAAGKSSRMGRSKQIEPVNGVPMAVTAVKTALRSGADNIVLVTGAYADDVTEILQSTGLSTNPRVRIIHNPLYANGQSTSVRAVIEYLQEQADIQSSVPHLGSVVFMPVDQPFLPPLFLAYLLRHWRRGAQIVAPSVDGIPRGAPALFDRELWSRFQQLDGDTGAKTLLRQFRDHLVTIETPANLLWDIDTPSDLESTDLTLRSK